MTVAMTVAITLILKKMGSRTCPNTMLFVTAGWIGLTG